MRADQGIMLVVGLLGGYVVYRMLKAPSVVPQEELETSFSIPATSTLALQGNPLKPRQGSRYRARLHLTSSAAPFSPGSSSEDVQKALEALGFGSVVVRSEPPNGWPAESLTSPGPNVRWVEGTWMKESMELPRPKEMVMMWQTRSVP